MAEDRCVTPDFGWPFQVEATRLALQVDDIRVRGLRKAQDDERSIHGWVRSGPERQHLDGHVGQIGRLGDVLELGAHCGGATNDAADDGLVQRRPDLRWVFPGQSLLLSETDRGLALDGLPGSPTAN